MFPNPQHAPTGPAQCLVHQPVSGLIAGKFIFPECAVAGRLRAVLGTTVPETTIHKDRHFDFRKNEIRFAEDFLISPPANDFGATEKMNKSQLGFLVPARFDSRHQFATAQTGKQLAHGTNEYFRGSPRKSSPMRGFSILNSGPFSAAPPLGLRLMR